MFPHTITVFNLDQGTQTYSRNVVEGVYWYGSETRNQSGKTSEDGFSGNIVIPKALMGTCGIVKGSYVVKGEAPEIQSMRELEVYDEHIKVTSVEIHDVGIEIDNMVIHGI